MAGAWRPSPPASWRRQPPRSYTTPWDTAVYILECSDGKLYVGYSFNLERRLAEHERGTDPTCFTYNRRPIRYLWSETFRNEADAKAAEKQIKGWSRKKKWALIDGGIQAVKALNQT